MGRRAEERRKKREAKKAGKILNISAAQLEQYRRDMKREWIKQSGVILKEYAEQYGREKGKPPINAERFFDFYVSKNWMIGKNKMKDWKAALRNWAREKRPARAAPFSTSRNTGYNELLTDGNW